MYIDRSASVDCYADARMEGVDAHVGEAAIMVLIGLYFIELSVFEVLRVACMRRISCRSSGCS
jgi:hypothetical protein